MRATHAIEFTVYLDQRPGELAGVLEAVSAAGVEVTGISVAEHNGRGLVRVLGEPVGSLRQVCESLNDSGVGPVIESQVISVETEGRPAALRDLAAAIAKQRLNLRYAYLIPARNGVGDRCVIRLDDPGDSVYRIPGLEWPEAGPGNGSGLGSGHGSGQGSGNGTGNGGVG